MANICVCVLFGEWKGGMIFTKFEGEGVGNRPSAPPYATDVWCRSTKSIWHGSGLSWEAGGGPSAAPPPGTCAGWHTDSPLEIGLATSLIDPSSSLLAAQRLEPKFC